MLQNHSGTTGFIGKSHLGMDEKLLPRLPFLVATAQALGPNYRPYFRIKGGSGAMLSIFIYVNGQNAPKTNCVFCHLH